MDFEIKLSTQELTVVSEALGNLPYKIALPVVSKFQSQITAQEQARSSVANANSAEDQKAE
jgi:16S rRNA A1518/A1519 N6-dimethyltransferase RsmA/KsgA/DIM1 with predicted DNA glycosylase/AP lyase activity